VGRPERRAFRRGVCGLEKIEFAVAGGLEVLEAVAEFVQLVLEATPGPFVDRITEIADHEREVVGLDRQRSNERFDQLPLHPTDLVARRSTRHAREFSGQEEPDLFSTDLAPIDEQILTLLGVPEPITASETGPANTR
jgi:hypothetical protein